MDLEQIYDRFDEEKRLNNGRNSSRVEFLTTTHWIDQRLQPGCRILDIGAGTGAYSLHYAGQGYRVTAVEPVEKHLDILMRHVRPCMDIQPILAEGTDLSQLKEHSYDVVLCLGPLYHLEGEGRRQCIQQAKRLCRPGGSLFFASLSHEMVFATEAFLHQKEPLRGKNYGPDQRLTPGPFTFLTPPEAVALLEGEGLRVTGHFAADGLAELMGAQMDAWDEAQFQEWMRFHLSICAKPEWLGASNHCVVEAALAE